MTFLSIPSLVNKKILGLCCNCREWWGDIDGEAFPVLAKTYFQWKLYFPWKTRLGDIFALSSSGLKAQFSLQFFEPNPCVPATCCDHGAFQEHGLTFPKVGLEVLSVSSLAQQSLPPAVLHCGPHLDCCGTWHADLSSTWVVAPSPWHARPAALCCMRWSTMLTNWNALGNRSFPLGNVTGSMKEVMWCRSSLVPFVSSEPSKSAGCKQCDASCLINNPFSTFTLAFQSM